MFHVTCDVCFTWHSIITQVGNCEKHVENVFFQSICIAIPVFGRHFCVTWEYILLIKNKQNILFLHHIALIASWVYNKGNFLHLVWKKVTGLQQNCCKVSDYQLGPALKKNPYIESQKAMDRGHDLVYWLVCTAYIVTFARLHKSFVSLSAMIIAVCVPGLMA